MLGTLPTSVVILYFLSGLFRSTQNEEKPERPSFDYKVAGTHEIKPHRFSIPTKGASAGFNQLHLTLTVSAAGDVLNADASGDSETLKFWPSVQDEIRQWKFIPFEKDGKAVTATVEEYVDLVPPERLPRVHLPAPPVRPNSKVTITLQRSGCFGSCPSYSVIVSTEGIVFEGRGFVVAAGKHTDWINPDDVRDLARKFAAADFYSMDSAYRASVTDNPTYVLSIAIGGRTKEVEDYVGAWEGMPAVISELEEEVDKLARTERWISGADGLVPALREEKFNFHTFEAQVMLKQAASRGETSTVQALVDAGVPLDPLPAPKPADPEMAVPFEHVGWLTAAGNHPETMRVLIAAAARKSDQNDKDLGLLGAARSGNVAGARALIAYGANPNADLSNSVVTEGSAGMILEKQGPGSVLIAAAESGKPEMVREILRYHPKIEARDYQGKTAIFAAGEYRDGDEDGTRAECVKLLGAAGANINARDAEGNTPLHETFLMEVAEELLKLGADVNARNDDGETPVFTNVGDDVVRLLIEHGADLTIRNNKGETVVEEAAKHKGPSRQEALKTAILQRDRP